MVHSFVIFFVGRWVIRMRKLSRSSAEKSEIIFWWRLSTFLIISGKKKKRYRLPKATFFVFYSNRRSHFWWFLNLFISAYHFVFILEYVFVQDFFFFHIVRGNRIALLGAESFHFCSLVKTLLLFALFSYLNSLRRKKNIFFQAVDFKNILLLCHRTLNFIKFYKQGNLLIGEAGCH